MSSSNTTAPLQTGLRISAQTAVGCGLGLLLAGRLARPAQKITAATLLGLGGLIALPIVVQVVSDAVNGPGSERGERRRLDSIRTDSGFPEGADIY